MIASKFRVEKVLGAGGMGVVLAARHTTLGNLVAIKLMQPRAMAVKGATERFIREGQAAAQLQSKHVAKISDVGQLDDGTPYMVMEHLSGADLESVVHKRGALSLADAAEYILQACDAIAEAHAKGIVHRDLKPANLFLEVEPDGAPLIKVLDFGIAKVAGSDQGLTGTSQGMGSGGYMSPEQMSSAKKVDHRADIWLLGVTLYELLTAHRPFEADSLEQFVTKVLWEQPTPLAVHRPDLPADVNDIVLRCLEKQPDLRFATVAHFAQKIGVYAPPRAQAYVGRIARVLGVEATNLAQTSPGMAAPAPGATVPTAFGPAPAVGMAAAAPGGGAPAAQAQAMGARPGVATAPGYPQAATPPHATGPYPQPGAGGTVSAPMLGQSPSQPMMGQSPSQPMMGQSPSQPMIGQSGPHPMTASQPGAPAASSGQFAASDGRISGLPSGSSPGMTGTDLTAARPNTASSKKPPVALLAVGGLLFLGVVGGGVFFATRGPGTAGTAESPPPPVTGSGATTGAGAPATTTTETPKTDAPPNSAGTAGNEPTTGTAAPGTSGAAGTKPGTGAKPPASAKTPPAASTGYKPLATDPKGVGIGGTRN
ncbi:MAG: protein kinase [Polyangiaceae bacterium]